jgi:hypothetical protein
LFGVIVAVVAFAPILWASVRTNRARRERSRLAREWHDVTRSAPSLVAVLPVGALLVVAGLLFDWSFETYLAISFAAILVGRRWGSSAGFSDRLELSTRRSRRCRTQVGTTWTSGDSGT